MSVTPPPTYSKTNSPAFEADIKLDADTTGLSTVASDLKSALSAAVNTVEKKQPVLVNVFVSARRCRRL
jgi:hypothetical protein